MRDVLASRLRECRKNMGLSQIEVATYCDITEKAYQNYELMTREPRVEILLRIAVFYQVSVDYLLGRTNRKDVNQ